TPPPGGGDRGGGRGAPRPATRDPRRPRPRRGNPRPPSCPCSRRRRLGTMTQTPDRILILDFGSQYTQLIARRIREERVFCEIHPPDRSLDWIRRWNPKGIILSGGPASVYDEGGPTL